MNFDHLEKARILLPTEGYSPQIGLLIASLEYCRQKTLSKVANLSLYQLDYHQDARANSIGTLLLHMAAVEFATQEITFYGRPFEENPASLGKWEMPLLMGERARKEVQGYPLTYYFEQMASVRAVTLEQFRQFDDEWLWQEHIWKRGILANNYWQWYHVSEDEMGHRGEINWLASRIPPQSDST